jgi:MarR family transcriptional regulator, 2-MHQ and catechol-resistance regulon repressor
MQFRVSDDGRLEDDTAKKTIATVRDELPWLDGTAVDTYIALSKAYWSLWSMFSASCAEFGLSIPRFNLLWVLYQGRNDPRSMTEIGQFLNVSTANVTKLIAPLEQDGWAMRVPQESDRRVVYAQLTPAGEKRFRELMPAIFREMQKLSDGVNANEKLLLNHLLTKLRLGHVADYGRATEPAVRRKNRSK